VAPPVSGTPEAAVHHAPRRRAAIALAAIVALAAAGALAAWTAAQLERARAAQAGVLAAEAGARAFDGRTALVARIDGHERALPAQAAACANCHVASRGPAAPDGSRPAAASLGPVLHRAALVEPAPRRGGPPSRFDEASFCRLLRTGEDPAGVLLPRAMPRYELDDAACAQLWQHLRHTAG
jgi:hypothetical protein